MCQQDCPYGQITEGELFCRNFRPYDTVKYSAQLVIEYFDPSRLITKCELKEGKGNCLLQKTSFY